MTELKEFCAGIVTYNPEVERLKENIKSIACQVPWVIICDNGSTNVDDIEKLMHSQSNIILIKEIRNMGIAYALNRIFEYALKLNDIKWVLTLDQDSICPDNLIEKYQHFCYEDVGIISPVFRDPRVSYGSLVGGENMVDVEYCITSGSLTNIQAWEKIKGFDEVMFIDYVDYDFCYRIRKIGYRILQINAVVLNHTIGNSQEINFFGKKIIITNHSNMRKYYMVRNYLYYRHKNHIADLNQRKAMRNKIIKTLIFEKSRLESVNAFFHGWLDGYKMICGKEPKGWKN